MSNRERFKAVLHFEKVDRGPNVEIGYWHEAFLRWQKEGLPDNIPFSPVPGDRRYSRNSRELTEYFGLDAHDIAYGIGIGDRLDPSPTSEIIAEDKETKTVRWSHGYVQKCLKSNKGVFQELDWPVKNREDWQAKIKSHVFPGWHNVSHGARELLALDNRDFPAKLLLPGFFWELRNLMGFEGACVVFHEDPELALEMLDFWGDYLLAQCKLVLEHYKPEFVQFGEDMSYNHGPMLSPQIMEQFLVPQYKKVIFYLNTREIDVVGIDSDGLIDAMIPILYKAGVNLWLPLEMVCRKGHDDLLTLCQKYPWLRIIGGMDKAALSQGKDAIDAETAKIVPLVKRGGYIPTVDHKVPPEVSLQDYKYYLARKKELLIWK